MLICRLLPDLEDQIEDEYEYIVNERFVVNFKIIERCRYTTCVRFSVNYFLKTSDNFCLKEIISDAEQPNWLTDTGIDVRLYHDANLAEVVDNKGIAMIPVNPYPNPDMLQKDEKQSLNNFLGEWLSFCLKHGLSTETIAVVKQIGKEE
jgi:uncharacterized protein YqiB (DUF1249 family)